MFGGKNANKHKKSNLQVLLEMFFVRFGCTRSDIGRFFEKIPNTLQRLNGFPSISVL